MPGEHTGTMRLLITVAIAAAIGSGVAVAATTLGFTMYQMPKEAGAPFSDLAKSNPSTCNVLGIQIHGAIVQSRADVPPAAIVPVQQSDYSTILTAPNFTIADEVEDALRNASTNQNIKGFIIDIDSPGGGVVSGQEIAAAIKRTGKPSVAVIHEVGASAGYLSASAADTVIAGKDSTIGSIGVTMSYLNQVEKDKKDGYKYIDLSSGPYKDSGSPDRSLSEDEKKLFMRDIKISRDHFVKLVATYRHIPEEDVDKLADGSTMLGEAAVEHKLVDQIGGIWDGLDILENKIGEEVSLCWQ